MINTAEHSLCFAEIQFFKEFLVVGKISGFGVVVYYDLPVS